MLMVGHNRYLPKPLGADLAQEAYIESLRERFSDFANKSRKDILRELQRNRNKLGGLTLDELKSILLHPDFLPSYQQIIDAFTDKSNLEEFCNINKTFEFFNEEYVNALADYLVSRSKKYNSSKEKPLVILEVGAGNGRLSHFLESKLEERAPGKIKIIATDSNDWGILSDYDSTEKLTHSEALTKYNPEIVIFSWLPRLRSDYEKDTISSDIRACASVQEYLLIGAKQLCGHLWETYGDDPIIGGSIVEKPSDAIPPYKLDNFRQKNLPLYKLQICYRDVISEGVRYLGTKYGRSRTVSFKRNRTEQ